MVLLPTLDRDLTGSLQYMYVFVGINNQWEEAFQPINNI